MSRSWTPNACRLHHAPSRACRITFEVLVVDDEQDVRELLADYFTGQGFAVTRAADGRGAILALERYPGRFGLVVTDVNMPGVDGFGVLAEARRLSPASYVVIVTGYASLDSAIQAVRAGAYDYLPKPFALGQLDIILQRLADHARLERASRDRAIRWRGRRCRHDGSRARHR